MYGNVINKHYFVKSRPYLRYSVIIKTHTAIEKKNSSELNIMAIINSVKKLEIFLTKGIENFISKKYNKIFCEIFHPDGFFTKRSSWMGR